MAAVCRYKHCFKKNLKNSFFDNLQTNRKGCFTLTSQNSSGFYDHFQSFVPRKCPYVICTDEGGKWNECLFVISNYYPEMELPGKGKRRTPEEI